MPQLIIPALTSLFGGIGLGTVAAGIAANLTASLIFSAASRALSNAGQRQPDLIRGLQLPTSLPPKRFAYGNTRVYGSWAPGWVVNNGVLYGCLIFNSRPSAGTNATIYLDKRAVTLTGDLFDFATGAEATNSPFLGYAKFWMGLGDQSGPPAQIMTEIGDVTGADQAKFWPSDRYRGLTVLWVRLDRGANASRATRWPRTPPEVEMVADWSLVYDPRDIAQDADDPATWTYSANQALCLLDAIRTNPIRRRPMRQIHLPSFVEAADQADLTRSRSTGGPEPKWQTNGLIVWQAGELIDQLTPLVAAGGGNLFQSGGQLGYAAAVYRAPLYVVNDALRGQPFRFTRSVPGRDLPRAVRARFVDPGAQYEMSDLVPYPVAGGGGYSGDDADGVEALDLTMVTSPTQAMHLQKIRGVLAGLQKRLSLELPPTMLDVIGGAALEIDFPRAGDQRSDVYTITQTHPARWLEDDAGGGVAFRIPVELRQVSPDVYSWSIEEEQPIITTEFVPIDLALAAPSDLSAALVDGVIEFDFDPTGSDAFAFEWQWSRVTDVWNAGGSLASDLLDGFGRINGRLTPDADGDYLIRVRATAGTRVSGWLTLTSAVTYPEPPPGP